ncbi:MAG: hypothetical protein K2X64_08600 [Rhodocyclaceae bacterium]|nr:hypothetical protein [Rhodocyclaceae bacterium]
MHPTFFAVPLALGLAVGGCTSTDCSAPEDELRASFESRLPTLEKLRSMSDEDKTVIRIAPTFTRLATDWSWPRPDEKLGFTVSRWNEYRRLFKDVGASEGLERSETSIMLTTKACYLGVSGKSFGYIYLAHKPQMTLGKLEEQRNAGIGYVPVSGNWYVFARAS